MENLHHKVKWIKRLCFVALLSILSIPIILFSPQWTVNNQSNDTTHTQDSTLTTEGLLDLESGLIIDVGYRVVKTQCGVCHSTALVTQNRASREGWTDIIRWMQATEKLWDLGENEVIILNYLEKNYAPKKKGRRQNLENVEWYEL